MHDLVIRNGTVVDGNGGPPRRADVAVDLIDDVARITAIATVDDLGRDEFDADGLVVTPGFIDLHTHFDAQIGWDNTLTPSSWHGVTTALMGNCGMTFAPVRPGEHWRLTQMMEAVEKIPAEAIEQALPWTWESFGGYLDHLEQRTPILNVAGMVGHCALRYYVMGDRAVDEQPTQTDIAELVRLTVEALEQGAAGFSTSRYPGHRLRDGRFVPGTTASGDEVYAIAEVLRGRGLFQAVLNTGDLDPDMELVTNVGLITGGRVIVASSAVDGAVPGAAITSRFRQPTPEMLERAATRGADITATLMPREGGAICGLFGKLPWRTDAWRALAALPHDRRLEAIRQPQLRRALIDEAGDAPSITATDQIFAMWCASVDEPARYMAGPDATLAALARAAGESPAETFLRCCEESDGRAMFSAVLFNRDAEVLASMLDSPRFLPGLGDAGAHLADIVDGSYTTFFLSHWVRDTGRVTIGEAVRRLTSAPADLLGVADRGRLEVGCVADINIIDLEALAVGQCEPVYDAPLGAPRLVQRARGYRATFVNGQAIVRDDEHTGIHAGRVLRTFSSARQKGSGS